MPRIGVNKWSVLCEIISGVILAELANSSHSSTLGVATLGESIVFSSAVLVEVQNTKTIFTYFYYKYLQLRILILMFAHLRVTALQ